MISSSKKNFINYDNIITNYPDLRVIECTSTGQQYFLREQRHIQNPIQIDLYIDAISEMKKTQHPSMLKVYESFQKEKINDKRWVTRVIMEGSHALKKSLLGLVQNAVKQSEFLNQHQFLNVLCQLVQLGEFWQENKLICRDLAAHNIFINIEYELKQEQLNVKVGDMCEIYSLLTFSEIAYQQNQQNDKNQLANDKFQSQAKFALSKVFPLTQACLSPELKFQIQFLQMQSIQKNSFCQYREMAYAMAQMLLVLGSGIQRFPKRNGKQTQILINYTPAMNDNANEKTQLQGINKRYGSLTADFLKYIINQRPTFSQIAKTPIFKNYFLLHYHIQECIINSQITSSLINRLKQNCQNCDKSLFRKVKFFQTTLNNEELAKFIAEPYPECAFLQQLEINNCQITQKKQIDDACPNKHNLQHLTCLIIDATRTLFDKHNPSFCIIFNSAILANLQSLSLVNLTSHFHPLQLNQILKSLPIENELTVLKLYGNSAMGDECVFVLQFHSEKLAKLEKLYLGRKTAGIQCSNCTLDRIATQIESSTTSILPLFSFPKLTYLNLSGNDLIDETSVQSFFQSQYFRNCSLKSVKLEFCQLDPSFFRLRICPSLQKDVKISFKNVNDVIEQQQLQIAVNDLIFTDIMNNKKKQQII